MEDFEDVDEEVVWKKKRAMGDPRSIRFVTFSCEQRLPLFHRDVTKDAFVEALLAADASGSIVIFRWVVMPEHVHLLVREGNEPLAAAMARLKACFARDTLRLWRAERPEAVERLVGKDGKTRFWLTGGGHDRWMRSDDDCREKSDYLHGNPVKRGLVARPEDWKWSSAWKGSGATPSRG